MHSQSYTAKINMSSFHSASNNSNSLSRDLRSAWVSFISFHRNNSGSNRYDIDTGLPHVSEPVVLEHARVLSEDIGFRTVGTREHALGAEYVLDQVKIVKDLCDAAVKSAPTRRLACEVWRQEGSGSHRSACWRHPCREQH